MRCFGSIGWATEGVGKLKKKHWRREITPTCVSLFFEEIQFHFQLLLCTIVGGARTRVVVDVLLQNRIRFQKQQSFYIIHGVIIVLQYQRRTRRSIVVKERKS